MKPLSFSLHLDLPLPSPDDKRADVERLVETAGIEGLLVPLERMAALPAVLRERKFSIRPVFGIAGDCVRLLECDSDEVFGIAVDIGTTNVVASIFDLNMMERVAERAMTNPQTAYGEDILSRMHHAMSSGVTGLRHALVGGLNSMIASLADEAGTDPSRVFALSIASNTVMTHFLLGLDVANIPVEPYIPVVHSPGFHKAGELGLSANPEATVYAFPNAGSYVGGDIISGILTTGIHKAEAPTILIDVGTNAEIVIGMREWLFVGAGAAGPALEGGIFRAGMRAKRGAIYRIDIDPATHDARYSTIGDAAPAGICGSGVIDLVAGLFEQGIIDSTGRFRDTRGVVETGDGPAFIVADTGEDTIAVSEREINNFLRSKAAMFASLRVLLKSLGLGFGDIERVFIAGALGSGVRVQKAVAVGMLPDIPADRYVPAGNTSLKGAETLLASGPLFREAEEIRSMITYREMNTDAEFMREFPDALLLPHSNPDILSDG